MFRNTPSSTPSSQGSQVIYHRENTGVFADTRLHQLRMKSPCTKHHQLRYECWTRTCQNTIVFIGSNLPARAGRNASILHVHRLLCLQLQNNLLSFLLLLY